MDMTPAQTDFFYAEMAWHAAVRQLKAAMDDLDACDLVGQEKREVIAYLDQVMAAVEGAIGKDRHAVAKAASFHA